MKCVFSLNILSTVSLSWFKKGKLNVILYDDKKDADLDELLLQAVDHVLLLLDQLRLHGTQSQSFNH